MSTTCQTTRRLLVQEFISSHPDDWERILSEPPYSLKVSRDTFPSTHRFFSKDLLMLKYSQMESDFMDPMVRECRGLILDADTFEVVSFPFTKFGNVGEPYCPEMDWSTTNVLQKVDGSLIKIVRIGKDLLVSTNGTIDAFKAPVVPQPGCPFKSFGEIVGHVLKERCPKELQLHELFLEGNTYMFEMVSPWTRVVIPHKECDMYFLGVRDNGTFQERLPYDHALQMIFPVPRQYPMRTLDDCMDAARELPWDDEGYVAVDKDFNRVKIKSPAYVQVHRLKGEGGSMSYRRALEIVRTNEIDEIVSYFPEFRDGLEECRRRFQEAISRTEKAWEEYLEADPTLPTRKDKALYIKAHFANPGLAFGLLDGKTPSVREFFMTVPVDRLLSMLGYREKKVSES